MEKDTICRLCSSCCPIKVRIQGDRLVAAERKSSSSKENRHFCPKVKAAADIVYSPDRLKQPLIRKKRNNGGRFVEASWDEALDLVADRFNWFKKNHGAESVAWLRGMAADWGAPWDYANRLMNLFGSPNTIGNGSVCHVAREMAHSFTYGAMTVPEIKKAKCIIVWGKNDMDTNPQAYENILHAKQHGAKLIVIDPIRIKLAEIADIWMQIKPGYDGMLAMSMIHEIISKKLYDVNFVNQWTLGFEPLKAAAEKYKADEIAGSIWLNPDLIKHAAGLYATSKPACIIDGNGLDMQLNVFDHTRAVCMLRGLTGNIDESGGDVIPQPVPARNIQCKDLLPKNVKPITCDYPLFNEFHSTWGKHSQSCLIDAILDKKPYPIKMLIVQSANPAVTMTDSNRVIQALKSLDFMVAIDLFMTKTASFADVILPAASCFEKTQLNRAYLRNNFIMLQEQVIEWVGGSWPDWKITFELARKIGLEKEFPWHTAEEAIDYQLEPSGITVEMLRKNPNGIRIGETEYEKYKRKGFATPSGKLEFYSKKLVDHGYAPVPVFENNAWHPISFYDQKDEFPILGISGSRSNPYTHTQFRRIPFLVKHDPEAFIDIHPDDARVKEISNNDMLCVETPKGRVTMKARVTDVVHPGSIRIGWGWGEIDSATNLNNLTDDGKRNAITCTPSGRSFMCRVTKVE